MTQLCLLDVSNARSPSLDNMHRYRNLTHIMRLLNRCRTESVGHVLYQALLLYNVGSFSKCLSLVQRAKGTISSPRSLYEWAEMSAKKYREVGGEDSPVEDVLRRCFIRAVEFCSVQCLPEFYIELHGGNKYYLLSPVDIHPLVFAFSLQYLCYNELGRQTECNETLYELSTVYREFFAWV